MIIKHKWIIFFKILVLYVWNMNLNNGMLMWNHVKKGGIPPSSIDVDT